MKTIANGSFWKFLKKLSSFLGFFFVFHSSKGVVQNAFDCSFGVFNSFLCQLRSFEKCSSDIFLQLNFEND